MDNVVIRVPTKQIIDSKFTVSSALRYSPSARCTIDANYIYRFLDIFSKTIEDTCSSRESV
jgi:hypothetical protein